MVDPDRRRGRHHRHHPRLAEGADTGLGVGDGARGRRYGPLHLLCLRGYREPRRRSDPAGSRRRGHRPDAAARGDAPCPRPGLDDRGLGIPRLYVPRPVHARDHRTRRKVIGRCGEPPVDHDGGRLRHRARRLDLVRVPVRPLRLPPRQGRRRQLFHSGRIFAHGPHARRPGQGGRGLLGDDRPDLRLLDRQRCHDRHLHHTADEARRLLRREGGRGRGRLLGQRSDHAAGYGRRGVPDGRVRGNPLLRRRQARLPARRHQLHCACLHRSPRGDEGGDGGPAAPGRAQAVGRLAHQHRLHHRRDLRAELRGLLRHGLDTAHIRRRRALRDLRRASGRLPRPALDRIPAAPPQDGGPQRTGAEAAGAGPDDQGRPALHPAGRRAGLGA